LYVLETLKKKTAAMAVRAEQIVAEKLEFVSIDAFPGSEASHSLLSASFVDTWIYFTVKFLL